MNDYEKLADKLDRLRFEKEYMLRPFDDRLNLLIQDVIYSMGSMTLTHKSFNVMGNIIRGMDIER